MGFSAALLLDGQGRAVALAPDDPEMHGLEIASKYQHLSSALAGERAVSDIVPSAVKADPIVAFALPLSGGSSGVLSSGFSLEDSPLKAFLERQPIPATRGYILDSNSIVIVSAGDGSAASGDSLDLTASPDGASASGGRLVAASPIAGTKWTYVLDAPLSSVLAPASTSEPTEWVLLVGLAAATLAGLMVAAGALASRGQAREQQAEADRRFRLTVKHAPVGMSMVSLDYKFVEPNNRLCTMLGYPVDELELKTFVDVTHPEDLDLDLALLKQLLDGEIVTYDLAKRYLRRDGTVLWGRLTVSVVRDKSGQPHYFVSQIEDVTNMRAAQAQLEHRALYDPLTGMANRGLLVDRLTSALDDTRKTVTLAVGFVDLDHFKQINDTHGHHAGDAVLKAVAHRLRNSVRAGDTVARMGGDEFIILLTDVESLEAATMVMDRARRAVEQPIEVDGNSLTVSVSGGLVYANPGDSPETLLRNSDAALYAAKDAGRGRIEIYNSALGSHVASQRTLEDDLLTAIQRDQFELHYQPIVDLADGRTVAFEALVRWRHPIHGLLMPGDFIHLAEESYRIIDLGALVVQHACRFLADHPDAAWKVFVNVSPRQLGRDLSGVIDRELVSSGVPATRLGIEITENGVLNATGSSLAEMTQLRELGIDILVDDFGTGYSALSSLMTTPITGIKLDRSFTARLGQDGTADGIASSMASLIRRLSLHGVAEGIETVEQVELALNHGWQYGQGYHLARPLPAELLDAELFLPRPHVPELAAVFKT
jgi:diguanylate cyclase (GGDEF)-like protein/PAS domain S-box-containing protein